MLKHLTASETRSHSERPNAVVEGARIAVLRTAITLELINTTTTSPNIRQHRTTWLLNPFTHNHSAAVHTQDKAAVAIAVKATDHSRYQWIRTADQLLSTLATL